jgi:hypothetical protein
VGDDPPQVRVVQGESQLAEGVAGPVGVVKRPALQIEDLGVGRHRLRQPIARLAVADETLIWRFQTPGSRSSEGRDGDGDNPADNRRHTPPRGRL